MTLIILNLLFQITFLLSLSIIPSAEEQSQPPLTKPRCTSKCGSVTIPFPFGIEHGCYIEENFAIDCNSRSKPFLRILNSEVLEISLLGTLRINHQVFFSCEENQQVNALDVTLENTPFVYSSDGNKFTALGCNNLAFMSNEDTVFGGCFSTCNTETKNASEENGCYGIKCCQTKIPSSLQRFNISIRSLDYEDSASTKKGCKYAFLVDQDWFETNFTNHQYVENLKQVPVVLDWGILKSSFDGFAMDKSSNYKSTSNCSIFSTNPFPLVQCNCSKGFEGNPYLLQGCQDIDECKANMCGPTELCENINGSHYCYAHPPPKRLKITKLVVIGFGTSFGSLILIILAWWLCIIVKKRKEDLRKKKFFIKNGGLLLEKRLTSEDGIVDRSKLFNSQDLDKATDHFNVNRIVGEGGQGTVYKGMLSDGRIVAVKKSKIVDDDVGKLQEFVNEVVILSKIKHRNIVELLGYCLETEVPLLVYEFIPNGTLSEYIHDPKEELPPLTWDMRLRIATEVVDALSYLHSAASMAIYHRDIKSANILLDSKYRAKVADFGISKSIEIDQTLATTKVVKGTIGYMDPEYFQSRHFTDKSDVYSFGVVLIELLTGQKPISEGKSLVHKFLDSMKENHLDDILYDEVKNKGKNEEIMSVAILACRCLNLDGSKRPSMKEVSMELQRIQASDKNNFRLSYEEIENMRSEEILPWDFSPTSKGSTFGNISSSTQSRTLVNNIGANNQ